MSDKMVKSDAKLQVELEDRSLADRGSPFQRPSPPQILQPSQFSEYPTHVLISGNCHMGAAVTVILDGVRGDAVVEGDRWFYARVWGSASYHWPEDWFGWIGRGAGQVNVTAEQTINGETSDPSETRIFVVKDSPSAMVSSSEYLKDIKSESENSVDRGAYAQESGSSIESVPDAERPPPPTITEPEDGSFHFRGRKILVRGACELGAQLNGSYESSTDGSAIYSFDIDGRAWSAWAGIISNTSQTGKIFVGQRVNGSSNSPRASIEITYIAGTPLILFPLPGTLHSVGGLHISGVCERRGGVEILTESGELLGSAKMLGTTWVFYKEWKRGRTRIKVRQNSLESDVIEFSMA